jgi:hypothetical protein
MIKPKILEKENIIYNFLIILLLLLLTTAGAAEKFSLPTKASSILEKYCYDCHDDDTQKGNTRLDNLETLSLNARLDLLNRIQEQVYSGNMPPKKKKKQPTPTEVDTLLLNFSIALDKHNASELEDKLRYYQFANYINHEKLFSGKIIDAPYTPSRRWLVNTLIYNERINDVFRLKGRGRQKSFFGVVKPFNEPAESGVKYYANDSVEGGQFLTLLTNAKWVVDRQLRAALLTSGEFKYPQKYHDIKNRVKGAGSMIYKFPGEMWNLKRTEKEFEQIIQHKGLPSDADIKQAINHQFKGALQRSAKPEELSKYLKFTRALMKKGGNSAGLRKMMTAVLMESDFIYRSEYGEGKNKVRKMLKPREASYAIAYALTDRIPDEKLVAAVKAGKLKTKEDYRREVLRILEDKKMAKPRLLRFFQDYFGYYNMFNVFKDEERFGGSYNPRRIVAGKYDYGMPGKITKEADQLVEWILKRDKDVLKELLTTDKFFVHYVPDKKKREKLMQKAYDQDKIARKVYSYFSKMDWKNLKETVDKKIIADSDFGDEFIESKKKYGLYRPAIRGNTRGREFKTFMHLSKLRFGKEGNLPIATPLPMVTTFGGSRHSVELYNFPFESWSYEAEQPFKVPNRMGILTHPAWLIAHSQNAHTDPIKRGKWIQEKLLGGFVPDVPITVDAKIPEDHHKTIRERFAVTEEEKCWGCHKKMNPLGYVLESFDDFGKYRENESLEHEDNAVSEYQKAQIGKFFTMKVYKTKKVNQTGVLKGTGDPKLDGKVKDYRDLMTRLAKSERVRQSFIRNVFRYFMGRNEMLSDSKTLIEADKAYVRNGGSFKALVVSLLTSDSFIYRK